MSRYIDADELTSKVRHLIFGLIDKVEPIMTEDGGAFDLKIVNPLLEANKAIASIIREQPTADVREVVHGEWIDKGEDYMIRWTCSNCGRRDTHIYDFCPDCGADMRGENNELHK